MIKMIIYCKPLLQAVLLVKPTSRETNHGAFPANMDGVNGIL